MELREVVTEGLSVVSRRDGATSEELLGRPDGTLKEHGGSGSGPTRLDGASSVELPGRSDGTLREHGGSGSCPIRRDGASSAELPDPPDHPLQGQAEYRPTGILSASRSVGVSLGSIVESWSTSSTSLLGSRIDGIDQPDGKRNRAKERLNTQLLSAIFDIQPSQNIQKLLEKGASVNATCRDSGASALHVAALSGDVETLHLLIDRGADLARVDRMGRQAVHVAAWEGELAVIEALSSHRVAIVHASVTKPTSFSSENQDSWNHKHDIINKYWHVMAGIPEGSTPLHIACRRTKESCVRFLLEAGAEVNVEDSKGLFPMDVIGIDVQEDAAKRDDNDSSEGSIVGIAKLLLGKQKKSSDPSPVKLRRLKSNDERRITALHTAVADNNLNLIEILLNEGYDTLAWNEMGQTPLHIAVIKKFEDALCLMLRHGNNKEIGTVNAVDSVGRSLLHVAVIEEWTDGISILLEEDADITKTTSDRENVLHMAAINGNHKILTELLTITESSLIINGIDNECFAPIHRAVEYDHLKCIEELINHCANADILLPDGRTLLHIAVNNNSPDLLEYLMLATPIKRLRESKTCKLDGGMTALHIAAAKGYTECVDKLIKFGCDLTSQTNDDSGSRPLHLAAKNGNHEVVSCVLALDPDGTTMDLTDNHGWYPLHVAAGHGHACCVDLMLRAGADLSTRVADKQGSRFTGLDIIMSCFHHPVEFLSNILDSYLSVDQDLPVTNPQCKIEIDFDLLIPLDPEAKQLAVLEAVLNNGNEELQEAFFLHPIVQTFIHLKSKNMLIFFAISFDIFFSLAFYLSLIAYHGAFTLKEPFLRYILVGLLSINILVEIVNVARLERYYLTDPETWIKWCVFLNVLFIVIHPTDYVLRYLMAISILLSWIELLLIIAKYPAWGIYVLMFTAVAGTVIKVLAVFSFLLLGFAFAFRALFMETGPFSTVWGSLTKVLVMVYELDYRGTFEEMSSEDDVFVGVARGFYLVFVLLVSVSLVNLMLGLAVSDTAELRRRGRAQRVAKRVAFLGGLENLLYGWPLGGLGCVRRGRAAPRSFLLATATELAAGPGLPRGLKELVLDRARAVRQGRSPPLPCKPLTPTSLP